MRAVDAAENDCVYCARLLVKSAVKLQDWMLPTAKSASKYDFANIVHLPLASFLAVSTGLLSSRNKESKESQMAM